MPINDRTIQWNLQVAGAPQAVNDMTSVTGAMQGMDDASRLAATRFTGVASASSALGTVLSRTTPQIGGLASALGTAGGATSGLVTAIGGVGGLAAGGLIAALALAVDWFVRTQEETRKTEEEFIAAGIAAIKLAKTITEIDKARAKASRRALDVAEERDIIEDIEKINTKIKETEDEHFKLVHEKLDLQGEERQIVFDRQRATLDTLAADKRVLQQKLDIKRAEEATADAAEVTTEWEIEKQKVLEKQLKTRKTMRDDWESWIKSMAADGDVTKLLEVFDPVEAEDKLTQLTLHEEAYFDARTQRMQDYFAKQKAEEKRMAQVSKGAFDVVATSGANAFMELVKGNEVSTAAIIEGIGDQLYSKGIAHLLEALAMVWIPGMQGNASGLAAAGGVEMAAGLAMGAAGAAAGGGSTGGGGGGGGGGFRESPIAARPTPVEPGRERFHGQPTELHFHHLKPSKDVGKEVATSLQMYGQKFGKSAMPKIPGIN